MTLDAFSTINVELEVGIPDFQSTTVTKYFNQTGVVMFLNIYNSYQQSQNEVYTININRNIAIGYAKSAVKRWEFEVSDNQTAVVKLKNIQVPTTDSYYIYLVTQYPQFDIRYSAKYSYISPTGNHLSWEEYGYFLTIPIAFILHFIVTVWWFYQVYYVDTNRSWAFLLPRPLNPPRSKDYAASSNSKEKVITQPVPIENSSHASISVKLVGRDNARIGISPIPSILAFVLTAKTVSFVFNMIYYIIANNTGQEIIVITNIARTANVFADFTFIVYAGMTSLGWSIHEFSLDSREQISILSLAGVFWMFGVAGTWAEDVFIKGSLLILAEFLRILTAFVVDIALKQTLAKYKYYFSMRFAEGMNRNKALLLMDSHRRFYHMELIDKYAPFIIILPIMVLFFTIFLLNLLYYCVAELFLHLMVLISIVMLCRDMLPQVHNISPPSQQQQQLQQGDQIIYYVPALFLAGEWTPTDGWPSVLNTMRSMVVERQRRTTHPEISVAQ